MAQERNITLHAPSRNIKPKNQTQNSSYRTLLLPRSFSDDKEAGTVQCLGVVGANPEIKPFPAQSGGEY